MKLPQLSVLLFASLISLTVPCFGQSDPPVVTDQVLGGTGGKFENVELSNGGVNLFISLLRVKGRGLDFVYGINYSSKIWHVTPFPGPPYSFWRARNPWQVADFSVSTSNSSGIADVCTDQYGHELTVGATLNTQLHFADGTARVYPTIQLNYPSQCPPAQYANYTNAYSTDLSATTSLGLLPDGSHVGAEVNGNYISQSASLTGSGVNYNYTDSAGRAILTAYVPATSQYPTTLTLADSRACPRFS